MCPKGRFSQVQSHIANTLLLYGANIVDLLKHEYRIAQLFGGGKYWWIWRTKHHSLIVYPAKFQIH